MSNTLNNFYSNPKGSSKNFNISNYLLENFEINGNLDRTSLYYKQKCYTYKTLKKYIERSSFFLSDLGLEKGDRIAILLPDTPEFIFIFLGSILAGMTPVPINVNNSADNIKYILNDCNSRILFTNKNLSEKKAINSEFFKEILLTDSEVTYESILDSIGNEKRNIDSLPEELAFMLYTSGTTGKPKGVGHSHLSMKICAQTYGCDVLNLCTDDIVYSVPKMSFAYGLGNSLYMPMSVGSASILSDATNAFGIIADLNLYTPSIFFGLPSTFSGILDVMDISPIENKKLRRCISAGEALSVNTYSRWLDSYGLEICEGMGTTELLYIFLSNRQNNIRPGSSGYPVSDYIVEITDDNGRLLPDEKIGSLQVTGKSSMLGYWNCEQGKFDSSSTPFVTGDKYWRDSDGFYWFVGRKDDLFKVKGQWVSPKEIEEVLMNHESISEAVVLPHIDENEGLVYPSAYISLCPNQNFSQDLKRSIIIFAKAHLPHFKSPKSIYFLDCLPRNSSGKYDRNALRRMNEANLVSCNLNYKMFYT
jgi:benzoate-CoA ligase family protein